MPKLSEADVAQTDAGDQTLVAGSHHGGQLIDPQAAEIVFDVLGQLAWIVVRDDGADGVRAATLLTIASSRG